MPLSLLCFLPNEWEDVYVSISWYKMALMSGVSAGTAVRRCDKLLSTITVQMIAESFILIPPGATVSRQLPVISLPALL